VWWPVPDLHAPSVDATVELVEDLVGRLQAGESLLMHCAAGLGRTGTMAACVLLAFGSTLDEALRIVGDARPMAGPEVGAQRALVEAFAARLR
jgi:protein-tyrosine phosphatase